MRKFFYTAAGAVVVAGVSLLSVPVQAGATSFVGELMLVDFNLCPRGWTPVAGLLLTINSKSPLFSTDVTVNNNGGGQPVNIRNPFLGMQWCVALQGTYPSRN